MEQLKISEIIVRAIVMVLQVLAIVGGSVIIGLYPVGIIFGLGGWTIGVASLVLIYEIIMISFALVDTERINHRARLLVDIILNSVMAVLLITATVIVAVFAGIFLFFLTIISLATPDGIDLTPGAIVALPIGNGILDFIVFIISAVSSGIIRSKLADDVSSSESSTLQPILVVVAQAPPTFVLMAPQPAPAGHGDHPPSYSQSNFATVPPSSHEQKGNVTIEAAAAVPPQAHK